MDTRTSPAPQERRQPLAGLTVLDLGQMYNGSYCGMLMGLHGARVLKIEPPSGEALRLRAGSPGARLPLYLVNSGKEGVAIDLKNPAGREVFVDLVKRADVLIENYAPGTMDRLKVGPATLLDANPRLVYATSTGYGAGGRYSSYPAMDLTIQAMTGTMATTGTPESGPLKTGPAVADFLSGIHLFAAITLALLQRGISNKGQVVEVAMADAVIPSLASNIAYYLGLDREPPRTGNRHSGMAYAPYNVYPTTDGHIAIFCVRDEHWQAFCRAADSPEFASDPRFDSIPARTANMQAADDIVGGWAAKHDRATAFAKLMAAGVPSAPVLSVSEVMHDPHFRERGSVVELDHPTVGRILVPGSPLHLTAPGPITPRPAPELGEHTDAALADILGLSEEKLRELRAAGAVGPAGR